MLKLCLQRALRPAAQKLPGLKPALLAQRLPGSGRHTPSCWMGTHGRNEPREPLNSPKRAKEFIYRLHPSERTCLLKELQSFESIAIAQGKKEALPAAACSAVTVDMHFSTGAKSCSKVNEVRGWPAVQSLTSGGDFYHSFFLSTYRSFYQ